ncbi:MAG: DNA/RNA nuclease SfsA [Methanopyri archaeon]|nr:DNA/RNA nuclease SfsA [Methanopyri archaeon]
MEPPRPLLDVPVDAEGVLVERSNRFLALVDIDTGNVTLPSERVHVHDPGRLHELLYPGNRLLVRQASSEKRSTAWDLIAARYAEEWVLVHSGLHRALAERIIGDTTLSPFGPITEVRPEVTVGRHRLDFRLVRSDGSVLWVEVKGCTLAEDGVALFPDAPTVRGRKHLEILMDLADHGDSTAVMVLVFRPDARSFAPKADTDPAFAETFYRALDAGVQVVPIVLGYRSGTIVHIQRIPVRER